MNEQDVLTALDVVLRLEQKVDKVLDDHESRIRTLEASGFHLSGVRSAIAIGFSVVMGTAGLALGFAAFILQ